MRSGSVFPAVTFRLKCVQSRCREFSVNVGTWWRTDLASIRRKALRFFDLRATRWPGFVGRKSAAPSDAPLAGRSPAGKSCAPESMPWEPIAMRLPRQTLADRHLKGVSALNRSEVFRPTRQPLSAHASPASSLHTASGRPLPCAAHQRQASRRPVLPPAEIPSLYNYAW